MDAIDLWLLRYESVHTFVADDLVEGLTEAQVRGRPVPGANPIAWLIWHAMRIEDVCVNRFILDRPQVLDAGWPERLRVARRDVGTGMDDAQVDAHVTPIAARVCALSAPGEILVSGTMRELARTSAGATFEDRGEQG